MVAKSANALANLPTSYAWYEHFIGIDTVQELVHRDTHAYRDIFNGLGVGQSENPLSIAEYWNTFWGSVNDVRTSIREGASFKVRWYGLYPVILLPIFLCKKKRFRKALWAYALYSYWVCPEDFYALVNAKFY